MQDKSELIKNILPIVGVVITIVTISIGLLQYYYTKRQEFLSKFWEKRYELYSEASRVAARIAVYMEPPSSTPKNMSEDVGIGHRNDVDRFWELYWGPMSIIEDLKVRTAMINFGEELKRQKNSETSQESLTQLSYTLARESRHSLQDTWEPVDLDDIPETGPAEVDPKVKVEAPGKSEEGGKGEAAGKGEAGP
jgi:hypothetical protein